MAYTFTQGTGTTASSDTGISGQHVPRVKITFGDTGTITDVRAANALPVTDTSFARSGGLLVDLGSNNDVTVSGVATETTLALIDAGKLEDSTFLGVFNDTATPATVLSFGIDTDGNERAMLTDTIGISQVTGTIPLAQDTTLKTMDTSLIAINTNLTNIDAGKLEDSTFLGVFADTATPATVLSFGIDTDGNERAMVSDTIGTLKTTGTIPLAQDSTLASIEAAVEILDDWDESDRAKINPIVGQAGVVGGAGSVGATTQRMTLASDDPGVASLAIMDDWDESDRAKVNPIAGQAGIAGGTGTDGATVTRVSLATDIPLPAGTAAIGKLAANSGVDIGDVDVTSISAGTNLIGKLQVGSNPNDSDGVLNVSRKEAVSGVDTTVTTSPALLKGYYIYNQDTATRFLHIYNTTDTAITVGTTTPRLSLPVPGLSAANLTFPEPGLQFDSAMSVAVTVAISDTVAPTTGMVVNIWYE